MVKILTNALFSHLLILTLFKLFIEMNEKNKVIRSYLVIKKSLNCWTHVFSIQDSSVMLTL